MGSAFFKLMLAPLLVLTLGAESIQLPGVREKTLHNGLRILMVERPGTGAVHTEVFIQGGRANTGGLPPVAADLLARTLFRRYLPAKADETLDEALKQEGGTFEALRLEALRLARSPGGAPATELQNLKALHGQALAAILAELRPLEAWDALDAIGASHRAVRVEADFLSQGQDLPAASLVPWCELEATRLQHLPMGRYPLERERLLGEMEAGFPPVPASISFLLATALSGRPYAQAADCQQPSVEALRWEDVKLFGSGVVVPERLTLVVVGDFRQEHLLPALEKTFGHLKAGTESALRKEELLRFYLDDPMAVRDAPGGRRLTVSTLGQSRLYFGWVVPPVNHPDGLALQALAQVLGVAPSSRLKQNLMGTRGIARKLSLELGVPGARDANLLVIEAEPAEGRSLEELEQAVQGEILRMGREPLSESEVRRAQAQLEANQLMVQEDAAVLAFTLGAAHCQGGDWRLAFRALGAGWDLKPGDIQSAARTYLIPARATIAQLGPDPLLVPLDRVETRMLQVLTGLVQGRLGGEAKAQSILREAMRQMRMLTPVEREQTLKLLEAQVRQ